MSQNQIIQIKKRGYMAKTRDIVLKRLNTINEVSDIKSLTEILKPLSHIKKIEEGIVSNKTKNLLKSMYKLSPTDLNDIRNEAENIKKQLETSALDKNLKMLAAELIDSGCIEKMPLNAKKILYNVAGKSGIPKIAINSKHPEQ